MNWNVIQSSWSLHLLNHIVAISPTIVIGYVVIIMPMILQVFRIDNIWKFIWIYLVIVSTLRGTGVMK